VEVCNSSPGVSLSGFTSKVLRYASPVSPLKRFTAPRLVNSSSIDAGLIELLISRSTLRNFVSIFCDRGAVAWSERERTELSTSDWIDAYLRRLWK
jgi:hypothetical protein